MVKTRVFAYVNNLWDYFQNVIRNNQEDTRIEITRAVLKYHDFVKLFPSNAEIRQDFEVLEIAVSDATLSKSNYHEQDCTSSNSFLMLGMTYKNDHFPRILVQILQNIFKYKSSWERRRFSRMVLDSIDSIMSFVKYLKDFVAQDLTEIGALIESVELLNEDAEILIENICDICNIAHNEILDVLTIVEKEFPTTEEHESKLTLPVISTNIENDKLNIDILSERTIIYGLRLSFKLVISLVSLSMHTSKMPLLVSKGEHLIQTLDSLLVKCQDAYEKFKLRVEETLNIQIRKKTVTVKGLSIPQEIRFTKEVNLYENTADMLKTSFDIINSLENVRANSISIIKNKSNKTLNPSAGISSSSNESVNLCNTIASVSSLKEFQSELEQQVKNLITLMKLESQIINKMTHQGIKSSRPQESEHDEKAMQPQPKSRDEANENPSRPQNEEQPTSFETCSKDEQLQQQHDPLSQYQGVDELFELITGSQDPNDESREHLVDESGDGDGVEAARQVVLEQLKTVLKPRFDVMKEREEEAYKRAYGERKGPSNDTEAEENLLEIQKKREIRQALRKEMLQMQEYDDGDDDDAEDIECEIDYGDNSDANDKDDPDNGNTNLFSSTDFRSQLDKILKSGAGSSYT